MGLGFLLVVSVLFCKARGIRVVLGQGIGTEHDHVVEGLGHGKNMGHKHRCLMRIEEMVLNIYIYILYIH